MDVNAHEEGFLRFVKRERRPRVRHLFDKDKPKDWLAHTNWIDEKYAVRVQESEGHAGILRQIQAVTKADTCYVISQGELDGKEMGLAEALDLVIGQGMGTVLSIEPGHVLFYEGEDMGRRFILRRGVS